MHPTSFPEPPLLIESELPRAIQKGKLESICVPAVLVLALKWAQ